MMKLTVHCIVCILITVFSIIQSVAQNPFIKCYFNFPVNQNVSTYTNATYLNGTFPDTIAAYINRAKFSIDVALYNYTSGASSSVAKIATAVNNAFSRGVVIRWIYNGSSTNSGLSLINPSIKTLASPTSSGYGIMHNKFVVIDANSNDSSDAVVITGSYNFSTTQTISDYNNLLIINSKNVAQAFYNEFNKMWGGTGPTPNSVNSKFGPYKSASSTTQFNVNGTRIEVYFSPKDNNDIRIENAISTANNDLFFGIYTFTDNGIANLIKNKINNGISTKGIIDQFSQTYSPYSILSPLMNNNLILYTGSAIYHNKVMLIDTQLPSSDPQVCTGSYNWSNAGAQTNDENMVIVHDSIIANEYYQSLCENFSGLGGTPCLNGLPIRLRYITSTLLNDNVLLEWQIDNEEDITEYVVEHSFNGTNFSPVKNYTNNNTGKYRFTDKINLHNTWYRLRIEEKSGSISYSQVIGIKGNNKNNYYLTPNPAKDFITIQNNQIENTITEINIIDLTGKIVLRQKNISLINTPLQVNISQLSRGAYILKTIGKNQKSSMFIKQ